MNEPIKIHISGHKNGDRTIEITMPNGDVVKRKTNHPYNWAVVAKKIGDNEHWGLIGCRISEYDARRLWPADAPYVLGTYETVVIDLRKAMEMMGQLDKCMPELEVIAKMAKIESCYHRAFPTTIHPRNKKDEIINKMVKLWDEDPKHEPTVALLVSFAKSAGGR